ncbi:hypothetical protein LG314_05220 [Agrococcus terreus]|uniref:hypothetical protein n=1 Tax=Agrococcus terreus TaxID=574649 RepID=UPI003850428B
MARQRAAHRICAIAIDPAAFMGREAFELAVASTADRIQSMEPVNGGRDQSAEPAGEG